MAVSATADGPLLGSTAPNKGHALRKLTSHASDTACTISSCPSFRTVQGNLSLLKSRLKVSKICASMKLIGNSLGVFMLIL